MFRRHSAVAIVPALVVFVVVMASYAPAAEAWCPGDCIDINYQGCSGFIGRGYCGGGRNIQCCMLPRSGINKRNAELTSSSDEMDEAARHRNKRDSAVGIAWYIIKNWEKLKPR